MNQILNKKFRIDSGNDRIRALSFINDPKVDIVQICEYCLDTTIISIYYKEIIDLAS